MNVSWRSGKPYDVIRAERDSFIRAAVAEICDREGAVELVDYPGFYITPTGQAYSTSGRRLTRLRAGTKPAGYRFVGLKNAHGERKYEMVHRLVAKTFIENPDELPSVNHKDLDKSNNSVGNLEWVTHSENSRHAVAAGAVKLGQGTRKLTCEQIAEVAVAEGRYRDIGAAYGVSAQTVCNIKRGSCHKKRDAGVLIYRGEE